MKTTIYNPSAIEIEMAEILTQLKDQISNRMGSNNIVSVTANTDQDNPDLLFVLKDTEGDKHEVVLRIIQRADEY